MFVRTHTHHPHTHTHTHTPPTHTHTHTTRTHTHTHTHPHHPHTHTHTQQQQQWPNALPDDGVFCTETCRSYFNANFNTVFTKITCALFGEWKTLIISRCNARMRKLNAHYLLSIYLSIYLYIYIYTTCLLHVSTCLYRLHSLEKGTVKVMQS